MANPYNDRRYGGMLSATQGFLDSYMAYQQMQYQMRQDKISNQYRQSVMRQHDRSATLFEQKQVWDERKNTAFLEAGEGYEGERTISPEQAKQLNPSAVTINMGGKPYTPPTVETIRGAASSRRQPRVSRPRKRSNEPGTGPARPPRA